MISNKKYYKKGYYYQCWFWFLSDTHNNYIFKIIDIQEDIVKLQWIRPTEGELFEQHISFIKGRKIPKLKAKLLYER